MKDLGKMDVHLQGVTGSEVNLQATPYVHVSPNIYYKPTIGPYAAFNASGYTVYHRTSGLTSNKTIVPSNTTSTQLLSFQVKDSTSSPITATDLVCSCLPCAAAALQPYL